VSSFENINQRSTSLFTKLIASFSIVIVLFLLFGALTFIIYRENLREQVYSYNWLNLKKTVDSYENQLTQIKNNLFPLFYSDLLQKDSVSPTLESYLYGYDVGVQTTQRIQQLVANPSLYLDNVLIYFNKEPLVFEKTGLIQKELMFTRFYVSERFPASFWKSVFDEPSSFRVYPSAQFKEIGYVGGKPVSEKKVGNLLLALLQNKFNPDFYVMAMLNADKLFETLHYSINSELHIMDDAGHVYFSSHPNPDLPIVDWTTSKAPQVVEHSKQYYFLARGEGTGLTYVNVVSAATIGSSLSSLYTTLAVLLGLFIALSIVVSFWLSARLNNPIKSMVEFVRSNTAHPFRSNITELNFLTNNLHSAILERRTAQQSLVEHQSLLRHFAYMNQLKNIPMNQTLKALSTNSELLRVIVYRLHFRESGGLYGESEINRQSASTWIQEFIDQSVKSFPDGAQSVTFRMESELLVSIVIGVGEQELPILLDQMVSVFQRDQAIFYVTIALSDICTEVSKLTSAYEQAARRLDMRRLGADTQVLSEDGAPLTAFRLRVTEQAEFEIALKAGNEKAVTTFTELKLAQLKQYDAGEIAYRQLLQDLNACLLRCVEEEGGSTEPDHSRPQPLTGGELFLSLGVLEASVRVWLQESADWFRRQKEVKQQDPVLQTIMDLIAERYREDLSLDLVAHRLQLTSGYVSTYFKAKMGVNFVDYLNRYRIDQAKLMLADPSNKIQDIAVQSGYQTTGSFIRTFKKITGYTPGDFRKLQ
jgi:AraC-like DNA-binding protein